MSNRYQQEALERVGSKAGPYHLDRVLDIGGMATVYVATHRGRTAALKLMHDAYKGMEEARVRFAREAYVANEIEHRDVVKVLDDGTTAAGNPFFVMELLDGASLDKRLAAHRVLRPEVVLTIADRILDVLVVAHERGVWHRDIKPGNIFITRGGLLKVLDFGLAYVGDGPTRPSDARGLARFRRRKRKRLTRGGTVIGTAAYMSPEQAMLKHDIVDGRADLFSVGALMFRCLTGRRVHEATNRTALLLAAATKRASSLADHGRFPPELVAAVDKALAFEIEDRWADAESMQRALQRVTIPRLEEGSAWPEASDAPPDSDLDVPISVSIHESMMEEDDSSIIVELESEHWELRRSSHPGEDPFEVVHLDEPFDD